MTTESVAPSSCLESQGSSLAHELDHSAVAPPARSPSSPVQAKWWATCTPREESLQITAIATHHATQCRANGVNAAVVEDYASVLRSGVTLPPVVVVDDGREKILVDGFHRLQAAKAIGRRQIDALVYEADETHAMVYAVGANAGHGLRRTNKDKQLAIRRLLLHPRFPGVSSRVIAEWVGVDHKTVAQVRSRLKKDGFLTPTDRVVGADGHSHRSRKAASPAGEIPHQPSPGSAGPEVVAATGRAGDSQTAPRTAPRSSVGPAAYMDDAPHDLKYVVAWDRLEATVNAMDVSQGVPRSWDSDRGHRFLTQLDRVADPVYRLIDADAAVELN